MARKPITAEDRAASTRRINRMTDQEFDAYARGLAFIVRNSRTTLDTRGKDEGQTVLTASTLTEVLLLADVFVIAPIVIAETVVHMRNVESAREVAQ